MIEKRPYPLIDEVKMHVFTWVADSDYRKLPVPVKQALNILMNELKISESLKAYGLEDDRLPQENTAAAEKKRFVAIFRKKYLEYADFEYNLPIEASSLFIIGNHVQKLMQEGSDSLDYLNWFFDEFMKEEYNKQKYAPPTINVAVSTFILNKYLFLNKDRLRVRKGDIQNYVVKNAIMKLATDYLEKTRDRDFAQNVLEYSRGSLSTKKFSSMFLAVLHNSQDTEFLDRLKKIIGE